MALTAAGLSGSWIRDRIKLANQVVTEIILITERIGDGRSSTLRVISQVRYVAEIFSDGKRLANLCRLGIPAVSGVVERCCNRRGCIIARRNDGEYIAKRVKRIGGRGGAGAIVRLRPRNGLQQATRFVISKSGCRFASFLNSSKPT